MTNDEGDKPEWARWDETAARELLGKLVVIGITKVSSREVVLSQHQMFGRVSAIDEGNGITVTLEGRRAGELYYLPPSPNVFRIADPGEYRLRETGEVVENPDYLVYLISGQPESH